MPAANALTGPPETDTVPCPEPAGGWPAPPGHKLPDTVAVRRYAEQHPERFGATWVVSRTAYSDPQRL